MLVIETNSSIQFSSSLNANKGIEILRIEDFSNTKSILDGLKIYQPHRVVVHAILLIDSSSIEYHLDFEDFTLINGDTVLVAKNRIQWFDEKVKVEGYIILFSDSFIEHYFSKSLQPIIHRLFNYHLTQPVYNCKLESEILKKAISDEKTQQQIDMLSSYLATFLLQISRPEPILLKSEFDRKYFLFDMFKRRVDVTYRLTRDALSYANFLGISYKHLNEICKAMTDKTAKEFVDDHIMLEAKRLLVTTDLSSKNISYECGFDEPTNFVKYFKKSVGMTPTAFRKSFLG